MREEHPQNQAAVFKSGGHEEHKNEAASERACDIQHTKRIQGLLPFTEIITICAGPTFDSFHSELPSPGYRFWSFSASTRELNGCRMEPV